MKTVIGVNGACGRMGQRIIQLAQEDKELTLGAALDAPGHPQLGRDVGELAGLGPLHIPVQSGLPQGRVPRRLQGGDQRQLRVFPGQADQPLAHAAGGAVDGDVGLHE